MFMASPLLLVACCLLLVGKLRATSNTQRATGDCYGVESNAYQLTSVTFFELCRTVTVSRTATGVPPMSAVKRLGSTPWTVTDCDHPGRFVSGTSQLSTAVE